MHTIRPGLPKDLLLLQQEKIDTLTGIGHDLKNVTALIQLNLAALAQSLPSAEQDSWHNVSSACTLLNTLVDNIIQLSKPAESTTKPALEPVNLQNLLQQICQPFQLIAAERKIDLQLFIKDELIVLTDPDLLTRLLINLLDNALKKRCHSGRQAYLVVWDTGPGIPDSVLKHWGQPHRRGTSYYQGTGLGLAIVRNIADMLKLPVRLYSNNRGTCFKFIINCIERHTPSSAVVQGQAVVIAVDPHVKQFLQGELAARGFQICEFNTLREFTSTGVRQLRVLIADVPVKANDDISTDVTVLRSRLASDGKLIIVSTDASVRHQLPDAEQLYFMLKPVKRSRLAWLLAQES